MAEKVTFDDDRNKTIIRTPRPTAKIIRWDWENGKQKGDPFDITHLLIDLNWQKTIKTPQSGCVATCLPQIGRVHLLDYISPMDVIQVYEFDTLKFQGFIRSIDSTGGINPQSGTPQRLVSIKAFGFGNLFLDGEIGVNAYLALGDSAILGAMETFMGRLADAIKSDDSTYADLVGVIVDEWYSYLDDLGAVKYAEYLSRFIDHTTGTVGLAIPGYPREVRLFQSEAQSMTLWSVIQKVCEPPFNEVWFDCGPRNIYTEKSDSLTGRPTKTNLPAGEGSEKTYMVVRATPFNGTVLNGTETTLWDNLPSTKVPLGYLTKFELNKTMDEAYSFYLVKPSALDLSDNLLVAIGAHQVDYDAFNKYLYRPMVKQQFFSRHDDINDTKQDPDVGSIMQVSEDSALTLKNWFTNNDQFLSGSFTIMVPSNPDHDPRIGEKLEFEGLSDMSFYCEGVAHSWKYSGPMTSTLSVTRGYGAGKPIELKDKIFKRGLFAMNRQFDEK